MSVRNSLLAFVVLWTASSGAWAADLTRRIGHAEAGLGGTYAFADWSPYSHIRSPLLFMAAQVPVKSLPLTYEVSWRMNLGAGRDMNGVGMDGYGFMMLQAGIGSNRLSADRKWLPYIGGGGGVGWMNLQKITGYESFGGTINPPVPRHDRCSATIYGAYLRGGLMRLVGHWRQIKADWGIGLELSGQITTRRRLFDRVESGDAVSLSLVGYLVAPY